MIPFKCRSGIISSLFKLHGPTFHSLWNLDAFQAVQGKYHFIYPPSSPCFWYNKIYISSNIFMLAQYFWRLSCLFFCCLVTKQVQSYFRIFPCAFLLFLNSLSTVLGTALSPIFNGNKANEMLPPRWYPLLLLFKTTDLSQWHSSAS